MPNLDHTPVYLSGSDPVGTALLFPPRPLPSLRMLNRSAMLRAATVADVPEILSLIRALAEYEQLSDACVATESRLQASLFGPTPSAEVVMAELHDGAVAGFALFCGNYSTFLAQPGIWLEDLFVKPACRGAGIGKLLLAHLAQLAVQRGCGRVEWAVLNWNAPSIGFYKSLGASAKDEWTTYQLSGNAMRELATGAT